MIFQTTDSDLATRNGQAVTVIQTYRKTDEGLPRLYRARFPDGFETDVWEDELADR